MVGGGAAGMSTALHLAPLVDAGLIRGPVDVYESTIVRRRKLRGGGTAKDDAAESFADGSGCLRQRHPGSGALGRDIGVGIWSTAWWPYLRSLSQGAPSRRQPVGDEDDPIRGSASSGADGQIEGDSKDSLSDLIQRHKGRQSYETLLQDLEACGSYVGDVGYRTPSGGWLVRSELNSSPFGIEDLLARLDEGGGGPVDDNIVKENPALLFVRERDLLSCLRNAVRAEGRVGTIRYHSGVTVDGVADVKGDMGSLVLRQARDRGGNGTEDVTTHSPRYGMIIAADGLYSTLRSKYAGHHSIHATNVGIDSSSSAFYGHMPKQMEYEQWEHTKGQCEATLVEERGYVVFRGNAPKLERDEEDGSGSFQTWGEENGMRFAAVPFYHATAEDLEGVSVLDYSCLFLHTLL